MLDAQNKFAERGPHAGADLLDLAEAGRIKFYARGTRVRVIESGFASLFVQVIEGPDRGNHGWVQAEFVMPET